MTDEDIVRVEVALPAKIDAVWQAFRDPEQIRRWHGWDYEGIEDEIKEIYTDGASVVEEGRLLHIGGHHFAFEESGDITTVRVTRAAASDGTDWSGFYLDIEEGWLTFLQQLSFALARHWNENRRSFYVSGATIDGSASTPLEVLEMSSAADVAIGSPYSVEAPWGPTTGTVWFRSKLQTGLTVNEWGDGLVVLTISPSAEPIGAHHGLVATMYDSDQSNAMSMELEVTAHWAKRYKVEAADS